MSSTRPDRRPSRAAQDGRRGEPSLARWQLGALGAFLLIFALTALLTGEPAYIIPVAILAALVLTYAVVNRAAARRIARKHGSPADALSDEAEDLPSAHLIPDDGTALGDTPEAHDEITPHDLPLDHPGREAAEAQAGHEGGTTRGHAEGGAQGGDGRHEQGERVRPERD